MGILNPLRKFFEGFTVDGNVVFDEVQADFPLDAARGAAIARKDGIKKQRDVLGNILLEQGFVFLIKLPAQFEIDRQENHDLIESLESWLLMKNDLGELPVLGAGNSARSVEFAGGSLKEIQSDGSAVYALDVKLIYERNSVYGN